MSQDNVPHTVPRKVDRLRPVVGSLSSAGKSIDVEQVRDNLFVLTTSRTDDIETCSGGNTALLITRNGVVLVDTKLAEWGQALLDKIAEITITPVTVIINTHNHRDHTGNNHLFGNDVEIIAHENAKANMEKMDCFKDANARFLPSKTYTDRLSIGCGRDRVELHYFGVGHTNGDTWVVFPDLGVVHTGEMFAWKGAMLCDTKNGGNCVEFPLTLSKGVAAIKNVDIVIPGHSRITSWSDLEQYEAFNHDIMAKTRAAKAAGKTAEEAFAAIRSVVDKYNGYEVHRLKTAVQAIYHELEM